MQIDLKQFDRKKVTPEEADIICIRALLQLGPLHDTAAAVRVLYEQGREAFEKMRDGK